jgi:hypothetical protein
MASEGALPFRLAAARWPSRLPSKSQILPLNREYESPAEMTSTNWEGIANFLTLGLDRTLLPSASSRRGS